MDFTRVALANFLANVKFKLCRSGIRKPSEGNHREENDKETNEHADAGVDAIELDILMASGGYTHSLYFDSELPLLCLSWRSHAPWKRGGPDVR